jgi:hypothetical protein
MWSHNIVHCPFFSRPGVKQLRDYAVNVYGKKVIVVKVVACERWKSRMSQFEQWENVKLCQK